MICPPCAAAADRDLHCIAIGISPIGHISAECRDDGRDITACGCQHHPPQDPDTPQEGT